MFHSFYYPFLGYLAIHLLGLSTGTIILPTSPSYFRRQQKVRQYANQRRQGDQDSRPDNQKIGIPRQNDKTATELASYAMIWWSLLGFTRILGVGGGFSRRMVGF
jgi:phosphatidylinositol glycan class W